MSKFPSKSTPRMPGYKQPAVDPRSHYTCDCGPGGDTYGQLAPTDRNPIRQIEALAEKGLPSTLPGPPK